ncbi:hypothetical protein ES703_123789 [subsurface metagenome]
MEKFLMSTARSKKVFLCAAVLFLIFGMTCAEELKPLSGKELLDKISSDKKNDRDYALGYITGVYCVYMETSVPDDRTMKKIVKIVKKYLKRNPGKLDRPAAVLLKEIFAKA